MHVGLRGAGLISRLHSGGAASKRDRLPAKQPMESSQVNFNVLPERLKRRLAAPIKKSEVLNNQLILSPPGKETIE